MTSFGAKIHDTLGPSDSPVRLLLINPNSTLHFTKETVSYLSSRLPSGVRIDFYTPPSDAPPSIDGTFDGVLSAAVILKDLGLASRHTADNNNDADDNASYVSTTYSAVIVSCFSAHPLVPALQERLPPTLRKPPVIGILEAAVHYGLLLGPTFGIATTGMQWEPLFDEAIRSLGISPSRYTGTKGTGFNAISLHGEGPASALLEASVELVEKGARVIVLGCAGMAPMRASIESSLRKRTGRGVPVIDGVQAAVDLGIAFARMGLSAPEAAA